MKLFAPKYYSDFKCIADKCRHSCCVGWEIDIDGETLTKYSEMNAEYAGNIRASIEQGDAPHFKLCADGRCAHLDEKGLCRILPQTELSTLPQEIEKAFLDEKMKKRLLDSNYAQGNVRILREIHTALYE
jgi:hypothetical protein